LPAAQSLFKSAELVKEPNQVYGVRATIKARSVSGHYHGPARPWRAPPICPHRFGRTVSSRWSGRTSRIPRERAPAPDAPRGSGSRKPGAARSARVAVS